MSGRALKDLREVGASPDDIHSRADTYRSKWPDVSLTPSALARRWAECGVQKGRKSEPKGFDGIRSAINGQQERYTEAGRLDRS